MSFITLEPGGARPPTELEKQHIRAALELVAATNGHLGGAPTATTPPQEATGDLVATVAFVKSLVAASGVVVSTEAVLAVLAGDPAFAGKIGSEYLPNALRGEGIPPIDHPTTITVSGDLLDGNDGPVVFPAMLYAGINEDGPTWTDSGNLPSALPGEYSLSRADDAWYLSLYYISGSPTWTAANVSGLPPLTGWAPLNSNSAGTPVLAYAPYDPLASYIGQLYLNTTTGAWYRWDGIAWVEDTALSAGAILANLQGAAADPTRIGAEYLPNALSNAYPPVTPTRATLDELGTNNPFTLSANTPGAAGNYISLEIIVVPDGTTLDVQEVDGTAVVVTVGDKGAIQLVTSGSFTESHGYAIDLSAMRFYAAEPKNGKPAYSSEYQGLGFTLGSPSVVEWTGSVWEIKIGFPTGGYVFRAYSTDPVATPELVSSWIVDTAGEFALCSGGTIDSFVPTGFSVSTVINAINSSTNLVTATQTGPAVMNTIAAVEAVQLTGGITGAVAGFVGRLFRDISTGIWYRWNGSTWERLYDDPPTSLTASKVVGSIVPGSGNTERKALTYVDAYGFVIVEADTGDSYMMVSGATDPSLDASWAQVGDRDVKWDEVSKLGSIPGDVGAAHSLTGVVAMAATTSLTINSTHYGKLVTASTAGGATKTWTLPGGVSGGARFVAWLDAGVTVNLTGGVVYRTDAGASLGLVTSITSADNYTLFEWIGGLWTATRFGRDRLNVKSDPSLLPAGVASTAVANMVFITQTEYDEITTPDANTLYIIV